VIRSDNSALARAVSFLIVGAPVLYGLARWTLRSLEDPEERRSFGWAFFLSVASITSLAVAATGVFNTIDSIAARTDFDSAQLAQAIAWGLGWFGVWRLGKTHGDPSTLKIERIAGSGIGLATTATAVWFIAATLVRAAYDRLFSVRIVDAIGDDLWRGVAGLVVGVATWGWYWFGNQLKAERTTTWRAYVVLIGILGGLITTISAGSTALFVVLQWFFGSPDPDIAARHFDTLPGTSMAAAVGVGLWLYHRLVLSDAGIRERTETDRVYDYVVAGVGLLAAGGGVATLLVAFFTALSPTGIVETGGDTADVLTAAVTLLVVGGPIWWTFWSRIQRAVRATPPAELASPSRRVFLFALFGVGGIVALISLIVIVFISFEDLIDGSFTGETFRRLRVPLALVVTTGAIAWYHWRIFDADREIAPRPEERSLLREVVVLGSVELADAISQGLDVRVTRWEPIPPNGTGDPSLTDVVDRLRAVQADRALVQVSDGTVTITPFRR
jgi:hypothetical protein